MFQAEFALPPLGCSPNARHGHWGGRAKAVAGYRADCATVLRQAARKWPAFVGPVKVHLDFYLARGWKGVGRYYPRDADNARASAKALQDALQDAGVIVRDSSAFCQVGETRLHTRKAAHGGRACVVMTLELTEERTNEET